MKKKLKRIVPIVLCMIFCFAVTAYAEKTGGHAGEDMWDVANRIIVDVYDNIAAISTVLAALMTTVCVVGMKMSNNQQKVDQSVDWLKRIWIAWAIINGIGAFLAYVRPLLSGLANIEGSGTGGFFS
jgi:hypothetical protein